MRQHPISEQEREQRRAEDRERLRRAAEQLLSSEGWRRWVRARASNGLSRYSLTNQLLVALQSGGRATFVAGFKQWLRLGYCVKRGERALRIMAPMTIKARDHQSGEENGETITLFKTVAVFSQACWTSTPTTRCPTARSSRTTRSWATTTRRAWPTRAPSRATASGSPR